MKEVANLRIKAHSKPSFLDAFVPKENTPKKRAVSMVEKDTRGFGKVKAKAVIVKNKNSLNLRAIKSMANVKKVGDGYKIMSFNSSSAYNKKLFSTIKAFNDIEIAYSADLEDNPLINTSSKPLWVLEAQGNGVFTLNKAIKPKKA